MEFFRKIKGLLLVVLFPALLLLMGNAAFNWHVHKSAEGLMIVHAHPYQKAGDPASPAKSHHHTTAECMSIQQITSLFFAVLTAFLAVLLLGKLCKPQSHYAYRVKLALRDYLLPNRAPPVLA